MIVADTGAVVDLIDERSPHHLRLRELFVADPARWVLPWAILPEVDHLLAKLGERTRRTFFEDVAAGSFVVEWGSSRDLSRARELDEQYTDLRLGLVDTVVMATAERLEADAIATLDLRDFAAVEIGGRPKLIPRDSL